MTEAETKIAIAFLAGSKSKIIFTGNTLCDGVAKNCVIYQSRKVEVVAGILPDLQCADFRDAVFQIPLLQQFAQVYRGPLIDYPLFLTKLIFDRLNQVGCCG